MSFINKFLHVNSILHGNVSCKIEVLPLVVDCCLPPLLPAAASVAAAAAAAAAAPVSVAGSFTTPPLPPPAVRLSFVSDQLPS
jgi:hypothetical protein